VVTVIINPSLSGDNTWNTYCVVASRNDAISSAIAQYLEDTGGAEICSVIVNGIPLSKCNY
jgi:hypothetical protein